MIPRTVLIFTLLLALTSCAFLEPSENTSWNEDELATYAAHRSGKLEAYEDLGYSPSKRLSDDETEALNVRLQLMRLERSLTSQKAREQYYAFRPYMESDEERVIFLSLPDTQARDRYAMQRGFYYQTNRHSPQEREAISRGDIYIGMTKDGVQQSWGDPILVEIAGNRMLGNERWKFVEYMSTPEGYQKEERVVIFEKGKVAGWQTR